MDGQQATTLVDPFAQKQTAPPPVQQTQQPALVDPYTNPPDHTQMNPKESQDASDSLIYAHLTGASPSYTLQNHDAIHEAFTDRLGHYANDFAAGLTKDSIIGEWARGKVPQPFESDDEIGKFIEGFGKMAGDLPFYIAGAAGGAALGALAGTAELPVVGTISGAVVGAGAGGFALTEGMRQWLVDKYAGKKVSAWSEVMDIVKATGKGAITGAAMGVAGEAAPLAEGVVGKLAGARAYKAAAELATMTTVGSLVEGQVPTAHDFVSNAALLTLMHVGMKGMDFAKSSGPTMQEKMQDVYAKDGVHPAYVAQDAARKGIDEAPTDNPMEVMQRIDNEIGAAKAIEPQASEGETPKESASTPPAAASDGETGIKNATTEAERAERGLPEVEVETRRSFGQAYDTAKEAVDSGKLDPRALASELSEKPRPLSPEESASLVYDRARLQNEHAGIMDGIEDARAKGDTDTEERLRDRLTGVEEAINTNDEAARRTGYEQGLGLAARRMMLKSDYSLANTLQRARVASKDGTVSPEFRNKLEDMTRQLEDANKRIDGYEEAKKQTAAQGMVEKIKRQQGLEARSGKRAATKEQLKGERDDLYKQLNAELQQVSANPFLNPKLYELFGKIAANHIRDGITTIEGIVDEIHTQIQDKGISKREIRDYISQYGRQAKESTKDEVQAQLREAQKQGKLLSKIEDAEAGQQPIKGKALGKPSERVKELRKQLDAAMKDSGLLEEKEKADPAATSLKSYKTRLTKRIGDLQKQLDTGDYSKPSKSATVLDAQAEALKAQSEKLKSQVDDAIYQQKQEARGKVEKGAAMFQKWRRAVLLSSVATLGKLQTAAMMRFGTTPIEELIGGVLSKVPGISDIAAKAPREGGGVDLSAEAKAFGQFIDKATGADIKEALKTGKTSLDYLYGKKGSQPPEAIDFFGHLHGAIKVLPKRAEFFRSLEKRSQWAIDNHLDLQDPKVQSTLAADAYIDANRAIFMQDNFINTGFRMLMGYFHSQGLSGKSMEFMVQTVLPIVKVPTNIVAEMGTIATGTVTGSINALKVMIEKDGLKNLTGHEADNIMRSLKKGSMGLAVLAMGYYAGQTGKGLIRASGFYQPGDEKKKDLKPEGLSIGGVELPPWIQHTPVGAVFELGATIRRVNDAYTMKGKSGGFVAGATAGALGAVKKVPFVEQAARLGEATKTADTAGLFVDDLIQSMLIPPDVRNLAKATDPSTQTRKPKNLEQTIESAIPGLRENVPTKQKKFSIRGGKSKKGIF